MLRLILEASLYNKLLAIIETEKKFLEIKNTASGPIAADKTDGNHWVRKETFGEGAK
jgi:hypothetical protein